MDQREKKVNGFILRGKAVLSGAWIITGRGGSKILAFKKTDTMTTVHWDQRISIQAEQR